MSQILMIILHERAVILLAKPEVSALQISTLAKNKILNIAPRAIVKDKNVKCITKRNPCKQRRKSHQSYF